MTELALFVSTFVLVFALGLQSLNVNGGHYVAAFMTSFMIGAGNLVVLKIAPHASPTEMASYLMGGPFGIIASMVFHRRFIKQENALRKWLDIIGWRIRRLIGRVVCLFKGHHYNMTELRPNTLYLCTRCRKEMFDRSFDDIEPMSDEDLEDFKRAMCLEEEARQEGRA